jgi:two-component system cell cycle sensor histidine kinase PleC
VRSNGPRHPARRREGKIQPGAARWRAVGRPSHHSRPPAASHHFGAEAGLLRLSLPDGTDASSRTQRGDAQLAFIQPVDAALADWRQGARLEITLLVLTGLVLALLAGGLWSLAPASARAECGSLTSELADALPGCGMWRWNLARGDVNWSAPMYRLLGLDPNDKAMAFGAVARALHPEDDLRGEVDQHLREGVPIRRMFPARHADGRGNLRLRGHITRGAIGSRTSPASP